MRVASTAGFIASLMLSASALAAPATVYSGGDILTMKGPTPAYVEALVEKDGKIVYVGKRSGALRAAGKDARQVNLAGATLMPGFIDAHGHLVYATHTMLDADLAGVRNIPELLARLKAHAAETPEGDRIVGMGYRAEQMAEKRHPTRAELDTVSATRPIGISDGSGHHGVFNSALMKELKLGADTPDPEGGFFDRLPGGRELEGHAAESAWMAILATRQPLTEAQTRKGVQRAAQLWVENGMTTASELGLGLSGDDIPIVTTIINEKLLPIDLVMFAKASASERIIDSAYQIQKSRTNPNGETSADLLAVRPDLDQRYINRVRLAGIKFWMDGSVDTAFLSRPFAKNPPGVTTPDYRGMRVDPQDQLVAALQKYWRTNRQIAAHAIGDEAIEQVLVAAEATARDKGMGDDRPIIQHAQFLRPDQLKRVKALNGTVSFTAAGIYPMGDYIKDLIGPDRLGWVGPANSAERMGVNWTINTDWPAGVSPSLIYAAWNVVNRQTRTGAILVPEERVTPYAAMRAITINGAYQYREEKTKGTLEAGKLADLVILSANPLKVAPMAIKDITVMQTLKEGQVVYTRPANGAQKTAQLPTSVSGDDAHPHASADPVLTEQDRRTLAALVEANGRD
jgi:predicted amidohydrolase YtcJ